MGIRRGKERLNDGERRMGKSSGDVVVRIGRESDRKTKHKRMDGLGGFQCLFLSLFDAPS